MSGLINIAPRKLGDEAIDTVDARELHGFLEVKSEFRNWIKNRIDDFGFVEGNDFATTVEKYRGGERKDYHLSIDMAKELAMVERTEKGKQARQYFIECERAARAGAATTPVALIEGALQALKMAPLAMRAARAFGLDKNVAAISANQYVCTVTGHNLLKEFGATHLPAERQDTQWFTPTQLSAEAKMSPQKFNAALAAAGLQQRRGKVWELLPAGQAHARLIDTGKRHNSGAMVQQIRWSPAVLDRLLPRSSSQGNLV
jgi:phage anti-repressor protein